MGEEAIQTNEQPRKKQVKPFQVLRQRRAEQVRVIAEANRVRVANRRAILKQLESGPATVPELAEKTGIASPDVLWCVMGLKKYGLVAEGEEQDGYFTYQLVEQEQSE